MGTRELAREVKMSPGGAERKEGKGGGRKMAHYIKNSPQKGIPIGF